MTFAAERESVQEPLLRHAAAAGWTRLSRSEATALRGEDGASPIFPNVLAEQLRKLNPFLTDSKNAGQAEEVAHHIGAIGGTIRGNQEALKWLRGERTVFDAASQTERNVLAADFDNPDANIFHATDEWSAFGARADGMFLLNGIPVAVAEAKSAARRQPGADALEQIRRYHEENAGMMATAQIFILTWTLEFHYGATWNLDSRSLFEWREGADFAKKTRAFFHRERFLEMLRDSILFYTRDGELRKSVLRPHQERAAARVAARTADSERHRGLVWHTQGSGKTFTMITAALRVWREFKARGGAGAVLLVIDRNELQGQLLGWMEKLVSRAEVHMAKTKKDLRRLLQNRAQGLIVTMIHKFENADAGLDERENIAVFLDEAHRSVEGDLGNYLTAALPNATLIGFTGTPVDRTSRGKGTFKFFGREDRRGYLDKYSISESIQDGTTVPVHWQLATNDLLVPRKDLDREFLELAKAEGVSDMEDLDAVLKQAATLRTVMKNRERVRKIAKFTAEHFQENVHPSGFKAFLVGVDREACALYKQALDDLLPPDWTRAIYSSGQNDSPLLRKYQVDGHTQKALRANFLKQGKPPHIFTVTDKLLTGFDAPPLYCMYLDKPMRDHVLLQAISRVNRPYTEKSCGLVVDFVGIFGNLEKALAFDKKDLVDSVVDMEDIMAAFEKGMREDASPYLALCGTDLETARTAMTVRDEREKFYGFFRKMQNFYELLSPDARLRPFMDDYRELSALYRVIVGEFDGIRLPPHLLDLAKKTRELVMGKVRGKTPQNPEKPVVLNETALKKLKQDEENSRLRIHNLLRAAIASAKLDADKNPGMRLLGDRAEELRERFESQQAAAGIVLEVVRLGEEILREKKEMKKSGLSGSAFLVFHVLKARNIQGARELAEKIAALALEDFPHYRENPEQERNLRIQIYRLLSPLNLDRNALAKAVRDIVTELKNERGGEGGV